MQVHELSTRLSMMNNMNRYSGIAVIKSKENIMLITIG